MLLFVCIATELLQKVGEEKQLQNKKDDEQLDEYNEPKNFS
jgi:hypothetical protein